MKRTLAGALSALIVSAGVGAGAMASAGTRSNSDPCADPLPQGGEPHTLNPSDFVGAVDNPYWPMTPRARWIYSETNGKGDVAKVDVRVLDRTKSIVGISATVVRDTLTEHGQVGEDTRDWYAQDVCGNVWYLGENTKEYHHGHVNTEGSWETGVDGAQAGVVVAADPTVGLSYRQEYYAGHAEDAATILSLDEQDRVPFGHFKNVLLTKDYSSLESRVLEYKFYAVGIGPVEEIAISGGSDRTELLRYHAGEGVVEGESQGQAGDG